jgi:hypothetical protein
MLISLSVACDRSVVSFTNKTDHHDITELLLKMALNTINQIIGQCCNFHGIDSTVEITGTFSFKKYNKCPLLFLTSK